MLYNKKQTQYMSGALTQNEGKLTSYVQQGIGGGDGVQKVSMLLIGF